MTADTLTKIALAYLSQVGGGLAVIVPSCFVAGLGGKAAAADGKAWAALLIL